MTSAATVRQLHPVLIIRQKPTNSISWKLTGFRHQKEAVQKMPQNHPITCSQGAWSPGQVTSLADPMYTPNLGASSMPRTAGDEWPVVQGWLKMGNEGFCNGKTWCLIYRLKLEVCTT